MEEHRSRNYIPILIILLGVMLQLQASGLLGAPAIDFLLKSWPLIIIAAGIDLFFSGKRVVGGVVLAVTGISVLFLNFTGNPKFVTLFSSFWPLLLIIYGVDMLFSHRNLLSGVIIVAAIGIVLYLVLGSDGKPDFNNIKLPEAIGDFLQSVPLSNTGKDGMMQLDYALPDNGSAEIRLEAPSGRLEIKAGGIPQLMTGIILPGNGERISESSTTVGTVRVYTITGTPNPQLTASEGNWNVILNPEIPIFWKSDMVNGYQMINLQGLNLRSVSIMNQTGDIDVNLPNTAAGVPISIGTQQGTVRIFVPDSISLFINLSGAPTAYFPADYIQTGNQIFPAQVADGKPQLVVNVSIASGQLKVVSTRN